VPVDAFWSISVYNANGNFQKNRFDADLPDLSLPWGQDAIIDAVATVNPNTIVVLETGNPVSMPWRDKVKAILQAWYPTPLARDECGYSGLSVSSSRRARRAR
jgi:hypothetical protein